MVEEVAVVLKCFVRIVSVGRVLCSCVFDVVLVFGQFRYVPSVNPRQWRGGGGDATPHEFF